MNCNLKKAGGVLVLVVAISLLAGCRTVQLKFQEPEGAEITWKAFSGWEQDHVVIVPADEQDKNPLCRWTLRSGEKKKIKIFNIPGEPGLAIYGKIKVDAEKDFTDTTPIPIEITIDDILNVKNNMMVKKVIFLVDPKKRDEYEKKVGHPYTDDLGAYASGIGAFSISSVSYEAGTLYKDPEKVAKEVGDLLVVIELGNRLPYDATSAKREVEVEVKEVVMEEKVLEEKPVVE
ncbi:MAG: hypothetical protein J7M38_06200 [Armatimonadetes bacterium]|nr:hypothetical protein [Armatimonadota bacterium]